MTVSSRHRKAETKNNSREIFVGFVWLVVYAVIVMTAIWRDARPLLAAMDLSGVV